MKAKLVRESLFDTRFTNGPTDIVKDMRIGKRAKIDRWFETWAPKTKYTIDDDLKITVNGNLDLEGVDGVTEIPNNIIIKGDLYLQGTPITKLPDNLKVGGFLDLQGSSITELPDNFTVKGNLHLRKSLVTELPNNLTIGGYLDLRGTPISRLPDNLTVGGSLDIRRTSITELPSTLKVKYNIYKKF